MKRGIKILLFMFSALLFGCRKQLNPVAYMRYVQGQDNGLKKIISIDNWDYVMQYKPYDYIIAMEKGQDRNEFDVVKRKKALKGTAWFNISIKRSDGRESPLRYGISSRAEYEVRQDYFLNGAVKEMALIYNRKDTLYPMSYEFENNYNLTPQETMVVGFTLPKGEDSPDKDMQLIYNDRIFKNGIIKALFSGRNLNSIPNINY